jgi:hypothetical protein
MICSAVGVSLLVYWACALSLTVGKIWSTRLDAWTRYGGLRHSEDDTLDQRKTQRRWGTLSRAQTFRAFYLVAFIWNGALLYYTRLANLCRYSARREQVSCSCATAYGWVATLFQVHTLRRLGESYFIHSFTEQKLPLVLTAAGLSFYVSLPVLWVWGRSCCHHHGQCLSDLDLLPALHMRKQSTIPLTLLLICFSAANFAQFWAHYELARVRKAHKRPRSHYAVHDAVSCSPKYAIVTRGLFRWSTCPHYLAEILIYGILIGYLVVSGCVGLCAALPGMVMLFVATNLGHTAVLSKECLRRRYPLVEFVQKRPALVPCLL